jgi:hypothetical protein
VARPKRFELLTPRFVACLNLLTPLEIVGNTPVARCAGPLLVRCVLSKSPATRSIAGDTGNAHQRPPGGEVSAVGRAALILQDDVAIGVNAVFSAIRDAFDDSLHGPNFAGRFEPDLDIDLGVTVVVVAIPLSFTKPANDSPT